MRRLRSLASRCGAAKPRWAAITTDLLLYCRGFCAALGAHHTSEDARLFSAIAARHPNLVPVVDNLVQEQGMIDHLISAFEHAALMPVAEFEQHLDSIGAIMESHCRYEQRQLLVVLRQSDW